MFGRHDVHLTIDVQPCLHGVTDPSLFAVDGSRDGTALPGLYPVELMYVRLGCC